MKPLRHLPLLLLLAWSSPAAAGGLDIATGLGGAASAWKQDAGPRGWGLVGYRFNRVLVLEGVGQIGYAPIDQRTLVAVGLGVSVWAPMELIRPMLRVTLLHQHEEPREAVRANVLESILGVGDGIRHRAGAEVVTGVGVEIGKPFSGPLMIGADARGAVFLDVRGPRWYAGAGLWASLSFDLG